MMSIQSAISRLQQPARNLVLSTTKIGEELIGQSEADQNEIISWINKTSEGTLARENALDDLDNLLVPKTYLATNYFTVADVALYASLHPIFARFKLSEYYAVPSLTRYFNHIQHNLIVRSSAESLGDLFNVVQIDLDHAPKMERKPDSKKKEKSTKTVVVDEAAISKSSTEEYPTSSSNSHPVISDKTDKKGKKKETAVDGGNATSVNPKSVGKSSTTVDEGEPVPSMIDLRVGRILEVIKHPDADSLYIEQIDLGEETGPRTVVSGLVNYIPIEQMRDKYLVAVCNLKPANMRGVKSFAMVFCATSKDGKEGGIELIQPPANSKPGDRVYFEGNEYENAFPLAQLNPKRKIFEAIQPNFITLDSKEAAWINPVTKSVHKIRTSKGICLAPTLVGASLS